MSETRVRHGSSMGQPVPRREGFLKVTGGATYAADNHPAGMLHAALCVSGIAKGRVTHLDVAAAEAHPGVIAVMTPGNAPKLAKHPDDAEGRFDFKLDLLQDERVRYAHQAIAVVVAETLEAATEGVALLAPRYEVEQATIGLDGETFEPEAIGPGMPPVAGTGDVGAALGSAPSRASRRCTRRHRSTTTRWSRTPSWRDGTATRSTSTRRARACRSPKVASPACSA